MHADVGSGDNAMVMTTINKKLHLPNVDGSGDIADIMQEIQTQAAGDVGANAANPMDAQFPPIGPTARLMARRVSPLARANLL